MSHKNKIQLAGQTIPNPVANEYDNQFRQDFNIDHKGSAALDISRGDAPVLTIDSDAEDVLLLEQQDGVKLMIRRDDFEHDFPSAAASRGADGTLLFPASLDFGSPSRGVCSWVVKVLSVFGIKKAAREATEALIKKFEDSLEPGPGFYRVEQGEKVNLVPASAPTAVDKPLLVFIHGTASSTEGSFGALWSDQAMLAQQLFEHYEQRVFAFEHRTLSQSPIENALALVKLIPAGATLHLVSHSRGGIVGELLCRGTVAQGLPAFSDVELDMFSACVAQKITALSSEKIKDVVGKAYATQLGELKQLSKELDKKRIKVERFVRVACPARGTTLASGRLDRWLSIMFNLIGLVPALGQSPFYSLFKNFALALVENKARPDEIPGLEAQMPDSPLVRMLNTTTNQLHADLSVISGDIEKDSLLGRIALLAPDKFYGGEHDLVVNTASMYGGGVRAEGARFLSVRGANVSHFNYFRNTPTANAMLKGLTEPTAQLPAIFTTGLPALAKPIPRSAVRSRDVPQPAVFIVPGIMGSELAAHDDHIWINMLQLVNGGMDKLNMQAGNIKAERVMASAYARLVEHLSESHEVITFPFDWRKSLSTQVTGFARELQKKLVQQQVHDQPLRIVAHSMGGLLTRLLISNYPELWSDIMRHPTSRFVMLGTPNAGSFAVPRTLLGQDKLLKTLALVDIRNSHKELLDIIRRFPGLLELLPDFGSASMDLFDRKTWERLAEAAGDCPLPDTALLNKAKDFRTLLNAHPLQNQDREKVLYVAGVAPETPIGLHIENGKVVFKGTAHGDGTVSWDSGIPANIKTWYMQAVHGDLADHPPAFAALQDLLAHGDTNKLSRQAPARARGVADVFDMAPEEVDMYPDQRALQKVIMGSEYRIMPVETVQQQVKVFVSHGDLAFARNPVTVGHYADDGRLFNAESSLNRCLNDQLAQRLRLGVYPGELDTCTIVMNQPGCKPRGAIVMGLGEVGKLSVSKLTATFSYALRNYGMRSAERRSEAQTAQREPIALKVSSLMIGSSAGGLPTRDALFALLKGAIAANKALADTYKDAPVYIDELEFIEWYEDGAINAIEILNELPRFEQDIRTHFDLPKTLRTIGGGRRRLRFMEASGWWQRLQIIQGKDGALRFNFITDRARTEVNLLATDRKEVDHFLKTATHSTYNNAELAHTLFEMLLPNELKERAIEATNLLLILNEQAARYPWELISDRWAKNTKPLAVTNSTIRQLESMHYRREPTDVHQNTALIVGEPDTWSNAEAGAPDWPRLPGALEEAKLVQQRLISSADAYQIETSFNENGFEILSKLHKNAYRVLHLAGHGVFDYVVETDTGECETCQQTTTSKKNISGMVIGNNMFLTPANVEQMRNVPELVFVNCCHLGSTEDAGHKPVYPSLAANLAVQFIRMGVRAVVAAGWEVDDGGAKTFASTFYAAMLQGYEFGEAVQQARQATYENHPGINTWGAYQCYGDPHYSLRDKQREDATNDKNIVAPSELLLELENIHCSAGSLDAKMVAQTVNRLQQLTVQASGRSWTTRGDLCAAFARVYGELDEFELATQWYERSLKAEEAMQPAATLEQLANLKTRHAVRSLQLPAVSAKQLVAAEKLLKSGIEILQQLCKPIASIEVKNAKRLALLGSAYKRKACMDVAHKRKPVAALKKMQAYYYDSHLVYARNNAGRINAYPYANYVTAKMLLHCFDRAAQPKPDAAELKTLAELEAQADARDRDDPGFWNLVGNADCCLTIHLIEEDLHDHATDIAQRYLNAKTRNASGREFQSVLEHVEFLNAMIISAAAQPPQNGAAKSSSALSNTQAAIEALLMALKETQS